MTGSLIVDCFAGPGGWEEGARLLGHTNIIGVEIEKEPVLTGRAAGHKRAHADVAAIDPKGVLRYGPVWGLIESPPCQAWSRAGKQLGLEDQEACYELVYRMGQGDDSTDFWEWRDPRSPLVAQPVRWVRELEPDWVALEQVPMVLPMWEKIAAIFRSWGYVVWTGKLLAADYGVAQTRERAFLMASASMPVRPPPPTHCEGGEEGDLFGYAKTKWVSMAEALGWGMTEKPYPTVASGRTSGGPDATKTGGAQARAEQVSGRWLDVRDVRHQQLSDGQARVNDQSGEGYDPSWPWERPATTLATRPLIGHPGSNANRFNGQEKSRNDGVRLTIEEAAILQSFRADYPWQGSRSAQFRQIGDAVPPLLAAHVLAALGVGELDPDLKREGWTWEQSQKASS